MFIKITNDKYSLNREKYDYETHLDGFCVLVTSLESKIENIFSIFKRYWQIEENFWGMTTNFKARPVSHYKIYRIEGHFLICFLARIFQVLIFLTEPIEIHFAEILSFLFYPH